MFTPTDLQTMKSRGISLDTVNAQIQRFKTGFPYLKLSGTATVGNGIMSLDADRQAEAVARWRRYLADGGEVMKFVPASGAASRMFKSLLAFVNGPDDTPAPGSDVAELIDSVADLAFFDELNATTKRLYDADVDTLKAAGRYKDIIRAIVDKQGMNYGSLPKALLTFHRYADGTTRTPLYEQLVEGIQTAKVNGHVRLHFTVSADHRQLFEKEIERLLPLIKQRYGVTCHVGLSEQKPSTDTLAVDLENNPFRDDDGNLVFRPGGHGALIQNLNDVDSAVVFIKNIDNIVPDARREPTIRYKEVIGGVLIMAHDRVEQYLDKLNSGRYTIDDLREMIGFLHDTLNVRHDEMKHMEDAELALYIKGKLDRPLRVCGMVRNQGEPGGGPYIAYNPDGSTSPQILESSQIDTSVAANVEMMKTASHFNPVDLVCFLKDTQGQKYDLTAHTDPDTGFISSKSYNGRELRALELPGLWNGAMSDWSTIFVEVPSETFNPVKTVNDLLRPAHQG